MNTAVDNKCPSCGASIAFNPKTQKWDCAYCGASFDLETFEKKQEKENDTSKKSSDIDEYICKSCGAKIVTDENTVATHCVYCGNTAIIKNRLQDKFEPDKIIPFKTVKEDAIKAFQANVKNRWFAPNEFLKKENIENISGVYIPFWLYDCNANGNISAEAKKVHTWSDSSYDYREVEKYSCYREGNIEVTDLPVDGSTKFEDDIMDSIEPYNYNEFTKFNRSYLSGFLAEKYDQNEDEVYDRAKKRIENTLIGELRSSVRGYSSVSVLSSNVNIDKGEVEYALLPVWMLNIKYKEQFYTFAMNGQTKKIVGKVPIDMKKLVTRALICAAISFRYTIWFYYVILCGVRRFVLNEKNKKYNHYFNIHNVFIIKSYNL